MIILATSLVCAVVAIKVLIDVESWGNVKHGWGLFIVAVILIPFSIAIKNPYPLFLYATMFNPTIALAKGLDFFYIGTTSGIDKLIHIYLRSGKVSFFTALSLTIISLIWELHF